MDNKTYNISLPDTIFGDPRRTWHTLDYIALAHPSCELDNYRAFPLGGFIIEREDAIQHQHLILPLGIRTVRFFSHHYIDRHDERFTLYGVSAEDTYPIADHPILREAAYANNINVDDETAVRYQRVLKVRKPQDDEYYSGDYYQSTGILSRGKYSFESPKSVTIASTNSKEVAAHAGILDLENYQQNPNVSRRQRQREIKRLREHYRDKNGKPLKRAALNEALSLRPDEEMTRALYWLTQRMM